MKPRLKRTDKPSDAMMSRLGLGDSAAAKALHNRHKAAVAFHDDELKAFTKAHTAKLRELEKAHEVRLARAQELLQALAIVEKLPDSEKLVADLKARIDALD